jgi:triacylglycerol lipase
MSCDFIVGDGFTVVAFAGTNDAEDWLTNLNVEKVDWSGYQLHAGFHEAESGLALSLSQQYSPDTRNLWVTGHSLGGILATLHALRFADGFGDECLSGVYTYGSPRGMDHRAVAMCDQLMWRRHYRHTHGNDIIPRVPSCWRFKHCGQHVHIDRHGVAVHYPSPFALLIDRVLGFRFDLGRDHFHQKYLLPLHVARFE